MATNISSIGTGQDYTTITAWESAVQGDLVTAGNIEVGECINQVFDERVTIDGSTTDASNYMVLRAASGAEHDGTAGSGARMVPSSGTGHILTVSDPFFRLEQMELDLSNTTGTSDECVRINADDCLARRCIAHTGTKRSSQDGFYMGANNSWEATFENCLVYGFGRAGFHAQNHQGSASVIFNLRNCTAYNCGNTGEKEGGGIKGRDNTTGTTTMNCDNCLSMDSVSPGEDFGDRNDGGNVTPVIWSGDGNIASDGTAAGHFGAQTANLDNRTATANASPGAGDWVIFTNLTAGSEDFHLQSSAENDAEGNGLDLSGTFTDDIDGDTRSDWDSGCDEIVAAAVPSYLWSRRASQRALVRR